MKPKKLLSIILTIMMTVSLCIIGQINVFAGLLPIPGNKDETLKEWMKYLPDSMPISEINMPGTHDAGTTYMGKAETPGSCQNLSIPQQFNKGMRVLDIRVDYEEGDTTYDAVINMTVNHNGFNASVDDDFFSDYMLFKHVFEYTRNFLKAHPSETVVLYVSAEGGDSDTAKKHLYNFVHEYHYTAGSAPDPDGAWLYEFVRCYLPGDGVPMLGDVRGKAVILLDNGDVENTVPPMRSLASYEMVYNLNEPDKKDKNPNNDLGGRVGRKIELVKEIFDDAVENNWKIRYDSDDFDAWPVFRTEEYVNYTNPGNPDVKYSGTNITDIYGVGSSIGSFVSIYDGPEDLAEDFWKLAEEENIVNNIIPGYRYGWITMDFPEMYSNFTKELIKSNYAVDVFEGNVLVSDIPEVKKDDLAIDVYGCYGTPNITYSYKDGTDEVISAEIILPTRTREHQSGSIKDCAVYVSARKNGQNYFGMLDTLSVSSNSIENDGHWYRAYGSIGMSMGTEPVTTTASVKVVFRDDPDNYDLRPSTVKEISKLCGDTVWEGYSSDHVKRGEFITRPGSEISLQGNCLVSFTKNPGSDDTYTLTGQFPAYWDTAGDEYVDFCLKEIVHIPSNNRYVASVEDGGRTLVLTLVNYGSKVPYIDYDTSTGNFVKRFCKSYTQAKYSPIVWNSGWYVMDGTNSRFATRVCGDVKLILKNGADLTVNGGFNIDKGSTLTIYAQEPENGIPTGRLNVLGGNGLPGFPGMSPLPGIYGSTVIHGGDINAVGGPEKPGISGDLTLYGGSITAQGGRGAVGIGGGDRVWGGNFIIYGGKVNAVAGDGAERAIGNRSGTNPCWITVADNTILLDNNSGEQIARPAGKTWNDALSAGEVSFTASTCKAYLDYNDTVGSFERKTCTQYGMVFSNSTALTEGWYVMSKKELMLNHDITVQGDVRLIIEDDYTLTVNGSIHIEDGGSLTVYTQSKDQKMGKLNVTAVKGTAIDGNLTLYGGNMTAKGGAGAAGIGGAGSRLTVYVGRVNIIAGTGASRAVDADVTVVSGQHITLMDSSDNEPIEKPDGQDWIDILDGTTVSFFGVSPEKYLEYNTDEESFDEKLCMIYRWIGSNTTTLSSGWYLARENVTIDNSLTVNGDVNLILADNCKLTVNGGVKVNNGNSLTVYAQSDGDNMGKLVATGSDHCAGIGGGWKHDSGLIRIHGGNITANGGNAIGNNGNYVLGGGAGIGGGEEGGAGILGEGGGVVIFGGNVTACGGAASAGIGGGYAVDQNKMRFSGEVYIYGGTVHAFGGEYNLNCGGAGIGSGACGVGDIVVINGGRVEATGGFGAAGIGGGFRGMGCQFTMNDGIVIAQGGLRGSGVGSGIYGCSDDEGGKLNFNGGTLTAVSGIGNAKSIGASESGSSNGSIAFKDDIVIEILAGDSAENAVNTTASAFASERSKYVHIEKSHIHDYSGVYRDNGGSTHSQKCLYCDKYGEPEEHLFIEYISDNNATCTADGTMTAKCEYCGATNTVTDVGSGGRCFTSGIYCDNGDGTHSQKCLYCDKYGEPEEHLFIEYISDNNATCTTDGTMTAKCECCGVSDTVTDVGSGGHSFTSGIYRDNGDGTHSQKCRNCDEYGDAVQHIRSDCACALCGAEYHIDADRDSYCDDCENEIYVRCGLNETHKKVVKELKTICTTPVLLTGDTTVLNDGMWYVAKGNVDINERLTVNGSVNLILKDGCVVNANKGIELGNGKELSIYGQSKGSGILTAKGTVNCAGIGDASNTENGGTLNIHGGNVTAIGGDLGGYGIGGIGNVSIMGGSVTATSQNGSCIGCGDGILITDNMGVYEENTQITLAENKNWRTRLDKISSIKIEEMNFLTLTLYGNEFAFTTYGKDIGTGIVTVALYDSADLNRLLDVKVFDLAKKQTPTGTFTQGGYIRAYWWTDLETMTPLCNSVDGTIE